MPRGGAPGALLGLMLAGAVALTLVAGPAAHASAAPAPEGGPTARHLWLAAMAALAAALLGYANGANDISKTIATLVGTGEASFRKAATAGAVASALGGLAAAFLASRMVTTFSSGLLLADASILFSLAVIAGSVGWVLLATRLAMPISTTHSITGAIVLTAIGAFGWGEVAWAKLWERIVIPLLLSPLLATVVVLSLIGVVRRGFRYCRGGMCAACHWVSAVTSSFARALNDAPKIVALLFTFGVAPGLNNGGAPFWMFLLVAGATALGALIAGLRVTETLAHKVTVLDHEQGLSANLATAAIVIGTAIHGLPVSTTHVSSFAIMGSGLRDGAKAVYWSKVAEMALAWVVTLPVSGLFGLGAYLLLPRL